MDIAEIFRDNIIDFFLRFPEKDVMANRKVIYNIINCRTEAMGGEVFLCEECGEYHYSYHSCKDRHCPKCGESEAEKWLEKQYAKKLPVDYYMVTFTIPQELRNICSHNKKVFYNGILFAASETLKSLLSEEKYGGGEFGYIAVLHTWTRRLLYHPHLHCVVPNGTFNMAENKWEIKNNKYFLPVKALSSRFRINLEKYIKENAPEIYRETDYTLWKKEFVTNVKNVGNTNAFIYLSKYVYKTGISNNRVVAYDKVNKTVTIKYQENKTKKIKYETMDCIEFIRRFLDHILPCRFVKVRYYGFLSSKRKNKFEIIFNSFYVNELKTLEEIPADTHEEIKVNHYQKREKNICPKCNSIMMFVVGHFRKPRWPALMKGNY